MATRAFIVGVSGPTLTAEERNFMRVARPQDLPILKRNIYSHNQVVALLNELRESVGNPDAPVLIDQRGRRAQRFGPPLADLPIAMTAHVVFSALDPAQPATTSATIMEQVIRGASGAKRALTSRKASQPFDRMAARPELDELVDRAGVGA